MHFHLNRSVRADDDLDAFLVSAISALLLLRFYLHLAHYPQVGGSHYHIAHMLYGGLLMVAAIALLLSFFGSRVRRFSAIIGGAGFGIFIDELGKFITRDVNYFYRPTIGIIYLIFVILYLVFNFLGRTHSLTALEYQLNALAELQDLVLHRADARDRQRLQRLLAKADPHSPVTTRLRQLVHELPAARPEGPSWYRRYLDGLRRAYRRFWQQRSARRLTASLFLAATILFPIGVLLTLAHTIINARSFLLAAGSYPHGLLLGQLISGTVAAAFAVAGAVALTRSRIEAFEWFRRAVLVNLYITEFFIFARIQFGAIPGLLVNIALLVGLEYALREEHHLQTND